VYANTPKGAVLAAVMYITSPGGSTPQPRGRLTQWHVHTNPCTIGGLRVGTVSAAQPTRPAGSRNRDTPPMIHLWFAPIPAVQVLHAAGRVASPANGTA
jgi:hypothetical protein